LRLEFLCEHYRQGIGGTWRPWHLAPGLEREFVHNAQDLFIRFDHASGVEVLANFAEHVAALAIERAHSERVRISLGVSACNSQFFGGPDAKEFVAANGLLPVVRAGHSSFSDRSPLNAPLVTAISTTRLASVPFGVNDNLSFVVDEVVHVVSKQRSFVVHDGKDGAGVPKMETRRAPGPSPA